MNQPSNVAIGLASAALGIAMILWVIPSQTVPAIFASVPSGFYPNFTSGMLIASGVALAISGVFGARPVGQADDTPAIVLAFRFVCALVLLVAAMWGMPVLGFIPAGIAICLATLVLMNERRWLLIGIICIAAPLIIWGAFEILLGRPLP